MTTKVLVLVLPMLTLALSAEAQTAAEWTRKVKTGKAIFVTTATGEEIAGKAGTAAPGTLTVWTAAGPRVVALADVQKIQKHDESWTGAAIGGTVGLVLSLTDKTEGDPMLPEAVNDTIDAFASALAVSLCALIGWGADALIKKRQTIYVANPPQPRTRASLVMKGRMVGLAISF